MGARGFKENSLKNQLIRAHGPLRRMNKPSMWALGSLADVMIVGFMFGGSPRSGNEGIIDYFSCSWELFSTNQSLYPALIGRYVPGFIISYCAMFMGNLFSLGADVEGVFREWI